MDGLDTEQVSRVIAAALSGPGGIALVVNVFANVPGVIHSPARRGIFSSEPERIQIGDWRYEVTGDGRLRAAHLVNGIVIAQARSVRSSPTTAPASCRASMRPSRRSASAAAGPDRTPCIAQFAAASEPVGLT